jgi:hypothetical protein
MFIHSHFAGFDRCTDDGAHGAFLYHAAVDSHQAHHRHPKEPHPTTPRTERQLHPAHFPMADPDVNVATCTRVRELAWQRTPAAIGLPQGVIAVGGMAGVWWDGRRRWPEFVRVARRVIGCDALQSTKYTEAA